MDNIQGKPLVSKLSGSLTPPNGAPIPWEDTRALSPPMTTNIPLPLNFQQHRKLPRGAKPSWRRAKLSGLIVMNPYLNERLDTEYFTARVPIHDFYYGVAGRYVSDCSSATLVTDFKYHDMHLVYFEQGSFNYWKDHLRLPHYQVKIDFTGQIEHAKTQVLAKLNTTYDLLTELAEGKDSIATVASLLNALANPLTAFKKEKDNLYKAFHRGELKTYSHLSKRVADAWMTYRYGIGPIIMSIQDILKTIKLKDAVFHTERSFGSVDVKDFESNPIIKPSRYLHDTISGSIQIRAIGKDGYSVNTELILTDLIGFNPLVTAWEKIPYSFVIDWALNVGDFLNAAVGSLSSFSDQRVCSYSVKQSYTIDTRLHWDLEFAERFTVPPLFECGGSILVRPGYDKVYKTTESGSAIVKRYTVYSYERVVFDEGDIAIAWNLQLSWKRILDALSLSLNQARKRIAVLR